MKNPPHEGEGGRRLLIFSKVPVPGEVKTRLVPPLTHQDAGDLAGAFLADALANYSLLPGIDPWLYLATDMIETRPLEHTLPELFREPLKSRITIRPQTGWNLGERLFAAFEDAFDDGCHAVCAVGSDHPTLPVSRIEDAFSQLDAHDLVVGPTEDGGYYLVGMQMLRRELLLDLPYSSPRLFDTVMKIAGDSGLASAQLPLWYDVDDAASLQRLWNDRGLLADGSATAAVLHRLAATTNLNRAEAGAGE